MTGAHLVLVGKIERRECLRTFFFHEQKNSKAESADRIKKTPPMIAAKMGVGKVMAVGVLILDPFNSQESTGDYKPIDFVQRTWLSRLAMRLSNSAGGICIAAVFLA